MLKAGVKPIVFSDEEDKKIRAIAAKVSEAHLDRLEKRGLPARKVYETVKSLSAKYTPGSHSFWQEIEARRGFRRALSGRRRGRSVSPPRSFSSS